MNILILSVGKVKERNILNLINDFVKRISYDAKIELREIKDSDKEKEGRRLAKILKKESGYVFALSEEGREYTSVEFAKKLMEKETNKIIFIIGGAFGLSDFIKHKANEIISLSRMTFTHELAKLFLIEQIYRAISINLNRKYHK